MWEEAFTYAKKMFQLVTAELMVELEYHRFTTPSELMDLGVELQWLLTT